MEKKKKVIVVTYKQFIQFITDNFQKIVLLVFIWQFFVLIRNLPYLNVVTSYYAYVCVILAFCAWLLFYKYITNKMILAIAFGAFVIAFPFVAFDAQKISEPLGFIAFVCLVIGIIQKMFQERKHLSQVKEENLKNYE